jgi:hypothetical protein
VLLGGGFFLVAFPLSSFGALRTEGERSGGINQRFVVCRIVLAHCTFVRDFVDVEQK